MDPYKDFMRDLALASRCMRTCFDLRLKALDLTLARGRILLNLAAATRPVSQAELTVFLEVEHSTAVRLFDSLEQIGYIARQPSELDRRAKDIALTDKGRPVADKVVDIIEQMRDDVLRDIDPEDLAIADRVLGLVSRNLVALTAASAGAAPVPEPVS
ncbi:MarR family winged helix-turn-helix transcriptional regulator [Phreatobacter stygius]|uniref:MarR family transcriptional regulator n=1 Tax=Phreatobacter stygius TaxID=1940610 RepID=A0A4D7B0T4_9HYPH|nr:MarR family transcriptional regulator [Phreatobacter stygius]QCI66351.1 MarR family transcriptional regulator [Phreatobacter stygius]